MKHEGPEHEGPEHEGPEPAAPRVLLPEGVLAVRAGPGANCSSIGSVIDLLFGTAIAAGAVYAAVAAALPDAPKEESEEPPARPQLSERTPGSDEERP